MDLLAATSSGDLNLLSLIIGAALALVGALLVQVYVVPRVDQRKRREVRWEEHLLALGEALTTEAGTHEGAVKDAVKATFEHGQDARMAEDAARAWDTWVRRIEWLSRRVTRFAPGSQSLAAFEAARTEWSDDAELFTAFKWRTFDAESWEKASFEDVHESVWGWSDSEFNRREVLIDQIEKLLAAPPPRRRLLKRSHPPRRT